jgi:uncharacterized protein YyaL (SSP411 family)
MYADRNADMVSQFLRAAALFEDPWLRDFALKSLETIVLRGYVPGGGVAHGVAIRGLLGDQVRVANALVWAHLVTGQLPYSMLALEVVQFAVRTMWDERAGCFLDRAADAADARLAGNTASSLTGAGCSRISCTYRLTRRRSTAPQFPRATARTPGPAI